MFKINNRAIGRDYAPYIIAELSANHGGSIESAKLAITVAKEKWCKCCQNSNLYT